MIIIPRRKLVVLVLFTIFFAVAVHILKIPDESAFSGEITKTVIIDAGHKALFLCFKISSVY